ncbi:virion protein [Pseudomonas phage KPP23]|nr:virion protein [Pseudomonas phage KPP23]
MAVGTFSPSFLAEASLDRNPVFEAPAQPPQPKTSTWDLTPPIWDAAMVPLQPEAHGPVSQIGMLRPFYSDIFYNRILVEPSRIDVGQMSGERKDAVSVSNLYFVDKTLESVLEVGTRGIFLNYGTVPRAFPPLTTETMQITITLDGDPVINARYNFQFAGEPDAILEVVGSRVVALPYPAKPGLTETVEWYTEVVTAYRGQEQRFSLRQDARQGFSYTFFVPPVYMGSVDNQLFGWRQRDYAVAVWTEGRPLSAPAASGDTVLRVDTRYGDFRGAEAQVMIFQSLDRFEVQTIKSLAVDQIELVSPILRSYENAEVYPVRTAYLRTDPSRQSNGHNSNVSVTLSVTDNLAIDAGAPAVTVDGIELMTRIPERAYNGRFANTYTDRFDVIDFKQGNPLHFSPWEKIKLGKEYLFYLEGLQDIWEFRQFLYRRKGQTVPFYAPSHEMGLTLRSTGPITNSLIVANAEFYRLGFPNGRNKVILYRKDGTFLTRTVISAGPAPDGVNEVLNVDLAINEDASVFDGLFYLERVRLNTDRVELVWQQNYVVRVSLPIIQSDEIQ